MDKNKMILAVTSSVFAIMLSGCGADALKDEMLSAQANNVNIMINTGIQPSDIQVQEESWIELDQLTTFKKIRNAFDDETGTIRFDIGSKNGVLYVDSESNWAGNNTLYNAMQNKAFMETYYNNGQFRSKVSRAAVDTFTDITGEDSGYVAAINAYWNILPTISEKETGLGKKLTRAEAMAAIVKADTPVTWLEPNEEFYRAVGDNDYTKYAFLAADNSFLDYRNGSLNYSTFNQPITSGEFIYMIASRYWPDELANISNINNDYVNSKNAGNIAETLGLANNHAWQAYVIDYCAQTGCGCPQEILKAIQVARNHNIVGSDFDWDAGLSGGYTMMLITSTYNAIYNSTSDKINSKLGANAGSSLITVAVQEATEEEPERTEVTIGGSTITGVRDLTDIDDLLRVYGDEIDMTDEELAEIRKNTAGWTFSPADKWMQVAHCSGLNIRTGPSTDYRIRGCVSSGTKAHIVAVCNENGWYRIIAKGKIVYQCGIYFDDFEGSENYEMRTGENANR